MIKITTLQLLTAMPVLEFLAGQDPRGLTGLKIRRLIHSVRPQFMLAAEANNSLLTDENSTVLEGTTGLRALRPELIESFYEDPLFASEVEIDGTPLGPGDIAELQIGAAKLDQLGPLFAEPAPVKPPA